MDPYHYVPKENSVSEAGILSLSKLPQELLKYAKRTKSENEKDIMNWLERSFQKRTRAIPVLTELVKWKGNDPMLKEWVSSKQLVKINLTKLLKDGLVESIWCKEGSNSEGFDEKIHQIHQNQIELTSLPWEKCSREKGLFFSVIRHYFLVMKDGYIPPEYLTKI